MAGFSDIIGHEQIIGHLKNAIALDKVSHAYIFNGPKLSGKMMLAEAFAMALQCEGEGTRPCLLCRSCKQAVDHNQPDIIYVSHEKPNTIGVDDIRTQINNDIVIKPYSSRYKVYIVDEAEKMNQQAQNALLKTIEEPPAYAVILLLTTNADSFLPTILSRCITLNLKVVKEDVIKSYLMKTYHIPDYQADVCAAFSQGNVGKAIQLASSEEFGELKASVLQLMKRLEDIDLYELAENCVSMLQINAEKHQVFLSLFGSSCHVCANKGMMEELLYNLCDNAIRYNKADGSVKVILKNEEDCVKLQVKDTGIGIPQKSTDRVFERFYRVDKSRSKQTGGTGLGLAIVKHIVAKHNAKITLSSELGKGTTITVIFPKNTLQE